MANRRSDATPIWHHTDTGSSTSPVGNAFMLTPDFIAAYAFWHPAAQATDDDLNEQRMSNAMRQLCSFGLVRNQLYDMPHAAMSADAWDQPILIQVSSNPGVDLVLWSLGPDRAPGGEDDILRYLKDCKELPRDSAAPIPWTYAGGGAVVLKPPPSAAGGCDTPP